MNSSPSDQKPKCRQMFMGFCMTLAQHCLPSAAQRWAPFLLVIFALFFFSTSHGLGTWAASGFLHELSILPTMNVLPYPPLCLSLSQLPPSGGLPMPLPCDSKAPYSAQCSHFFFPSHTNLPTCCLMCFMAHCSQSVSSV